jgi:hypothetical protein
MEPLTAVTAPKASRTRQHGLAKKVRLAAAGLMAGVVLLGTALVGLGAVTGDHTMGTVSYDQIPPNSGDHSPVWQRCGFYAEPIGNEHAVHSLEHGVVWITYQPNLPQGQLNELRALAGSDDEVLVSPYPGLPSPVVVSAWERQMSIESAEAPLLVQAVRDIRDGLDAPEPGGGCDGPNLWLSGGTGSPEE